MSGDCSASHGRNPFFCTARIPFTFHDSIFTMLIAISSIIRKYDDNQQTHAKTKKAGLFKNPAFLTNGSLLNR
jgi:hypothetical protein